MTTLPSFMSIPSISLDRSGFLALIILAQGTPPPRRGTGHGKSKVKLGVVYTGHSLTVGPITRKSSTMRKSVEQLWGRAFD